MSSSKILEQAAPCGDYAIQASDLIADMLRIADEVDGKDDIPIAKLQIDVRQWVVESYLLKTARKTSGDEAPGVFAVNIHTSADSQETA